MKTNEFLTESEIEDAITGLVGLGNKEKIAKGMVLDAMKILPRKAKAETIIKFAMLTPENQQKQIDNSKKVIEDTILRAMKANMDNWTSAEKVKKALEILNKDPDFNLDEITAAMVILGKKHYRELKS